MPSTSTKKARLASPSGVSSSTGPRCATSGTRSALHEPAHAVEVIGQRAGLEALALDAFPLLPRERGLDHLLDTVVLDHRGAVAVEDDDVAGADRRAADLDRDVELADRLLGRAADAHPA